MLSVIVPSNRVGGLDVLFAGLEAQTYRDFELILVDNLERRAPHVRKRYVNSFNGLLSGYVEEPRLSANRAKHFPVNVVTAQPNPFPATAYCRSVNTGIEHARGDTIVLLCDYSYLHPDCLATHAELQKKRPGPLHLDYDYCALPKLHPEFPGYHQTGVPEAEQEAATNAATDRYVEDLQAGKLGRFMWSIFAEPFTSPEGLAIMYRHRPCETRKAGDWNWCSFKNESFPTELFLEMNGLDEAYDESHCYQDLEFSYRLKERGIEWQNGPPETGMVTVVNPRPVLNVKRLGKPIAHNKRMCELTRAAGLRLPVNPDWSLRERRERAIGVAHHPA